MAFVGNLLWFILGGWAMGLSMILAGALWCITIIGIPFGVALFRLSRFGFFPFGKELVNAEDVGEKRVAGTGFMALLWIVFYGFWAAISYAVLGLCYFCSIIGIPFGIASFKLAAASFNPLGKRIVSTDMAQVIRARKANAALNAKLGK